MRAGAAGWPTCRGPSDGAMHHPGVIELLPDRSLRDMHCTRAFTAEHQHATLSLQQKLRHAGHQRHDCVRWLEKDRKVHDQPTLAPSVLVLTSTSSHSLAMARSRNFMHTLLAGALPAPLWFFHEHSYDSACHVSGPSVADILSSPSGRSSHLPARGHSQRSVEPRTARLARTPPPGCSAADRRAVSSVRFRVMRWYAAQLRRAGRVVAEHGTDCDVTVLVSATGLRS